MENQLIVHEICPTTTQAWLKEGALLVDVRENDEVAQLAFDVPNLIHIPLSEFEDRFQELPKDKKLILACKAGSRSWRATAYLMHNDYDNVVNMKHGLERWVQKGFPTKGDTSTLTNNDSCCSGSSCC
jgi:rhodanese-related sulfurtransferase